MNLDDLMEVWRSQDAAPLHGVNETLLRLALRQDEAKLQATHRRLRRSNYFGMALAVGIMVFFLLILITPQVDDVSGWDYAVAVVGLAAALAIWGMMYVGYRAQARREQRFGESLRDQVNRQIALIDRFMINPWATRAGRAKAVPIFMLSLVLVAAIGFMSARVNEHKPYDDALRSAVGTILIGLFGGWVAGLWLRRWNRRIGAPRKRRLEALLKEFDG
jgi:O-antigen/teichoic acid export membrane protein